MRRIGMGPILTNDKHLSCRNHFQTGISEDSCGAVSADKEARHYGHTLSLYFGSRDRRIKKSHKNGHFKFKLFKRFFKK